jgi:hypothetical protein
MWTIARAAALTAVLLAASACDGSTPPAPKAAPSSTAQVFTPPPVETAKAPGPLCELVTAGEVGQVLGEAVERYWGDGESCAWKQVNGDALMAVWYQVYSLADREIFASCNARAARITIADSPAYLDEAKTCVAVALLPSASARGTFSIDYHHWREKPDAKTTAIALAELLLTRYRATV